MYEFLHLFRTELFTVQSYVDMLHNKRTGNMPYKCSSEVNYSILGSLKYVSVNKLKSLALFQYLFILI